MQDLIINDGIKYSSVAKSQHQQTLLKDMLELKEKHDVDGAVARYIYGEALIFNVTGSALFKTIINVVANYENKFSIYYVFNHAKILLTQVVVVSSLNQNKLKNMRNNKLHGDE